MALGLSAAAVTADKLKSTDRQYGKFVSGPGGLTTSNRLGIGSTCPINTFEIRNDSTDPIMTITPDGKFYVDLDGKGLKLAASGKEVLEAFNISKCVGMKFDATTTRYNVT